MNSIPLPSPDHTLDLFGQYGGLIGVIIGMLFLLILAGSVIGFFLQRWNSVATHKRMEELAATIAGQGKDIAASIRDTADTFVTALEGLQKNQQEERKEMLGLINDLSRRGNVAHKPRTIPMKRAA